MGDDNGAEGRGILQGPAHDFAVAHRHAVVRHGRAAGFLEFADFREVFAFLPLGDAADGIDATGPFLLGLAADIEGDAFVIDYRLGVGHAGNGREAAGDRGSRSGNHVLLVFESGIAQVDMNVDQPRHDQLAACVDLLRSLFGDILGNPADIPVFDQNVEDAVDIVCRIDNPSAFDKYAHDVPTDKRKF